MHVEEKPQLYQEEKTETASTYSGAVARAYTRHLFLWEKQTIEARLTALRDELAKMQAIISNSSNLPNNPGSSSPDLDDDEKMTSPFSQVPCLVTSSLPKSNPLYDAYAQLEKKLSERQRLVIAKKTLESQVYASKYGLGDWRIRQQREAALENKKDELKSVDDDIAICRLTISKLESVHRATLVESPSDVSPPSSQGRDIGAVMSRISSLTAEINQLTDELLSVAGVELDPLAGMCRIQPSGHRRVRSDLVPRQRPLPFVRFLIRAASLKERRQVSPAPMLGFPQIEEEREVKTEQKRAAHPASACFLKSYFEMLSRFFLMLGPFMPTYVPILGGASMLSAIVNTFFSERDLLSSDIDAQENFARVSLDRLAYLFLKQEIERKAPPVDLNNTEIERVIKEAVEAQLAKFGETIAAEARAKSPPYLSPVEEVAHALPTINLDKLGKVLSLNLSISGVFSFLAAVLDLLANLDVLPGTFTREKTPTLLFVGIAYVLGLMPEAFAKFYVGKNKQAIHGFANSMIQKEQTFHGDEADNPISDYLDKQLKLHIAEDKHTEAFSLGKGTWKRILANLDTVSVAILTIVAAFTDIFPLLFETGIMAHHLHAAIQSAENEAIREIRAITHLPTVIRSFETGGVASPIPHEDLKGKIIRKIDDHLRDLKKVRKKNNNLFKGSVGSLLLAGVLFAVNWFLYSGDKNIWEMKNNDGVFMSLFFRLVISALMFFALYKGSQFVSSVHQRPAEGRCCFFRGEQAEDKQEPQPGLQLEQ